MPNIVVLEKLPNTPGNVISGIGAYGRQRLYIFPTRQGLVFMFLLLIMLALAINYSNSMAYIMTFLLSGLLMVGMLHTYRNLRGLIISALAADPVFAGDDIHFPLLLDNRTGLTRIAVLVEPAVRKNKKGRRGIAPEPLQVNLEPESITRKNLLLRTSKRGYVRPGRLKIASCYPLGLFRAWSYLEPEHAFLVYPRPAGSRQLPAYVELESEQQTGKKAGTDDFTGFKPYRHGDSIRNIDWKAFAREQSLQVKRFSGSGASKLILSWNQCGYANDVEQRLSQLCLWVLLAEREGFHYGLEIPDSFIDPGKGDLHMQKCLTLLACYGLAEYSK